MAFAQKAHMEQRSKGVEAEDMYSNCVQMQMKNVVKSKKSKFWGIKSCLIYLQ